MTKITEKIQERIDARLKKIEDTDRIEKNNLDSLLRLYQLKAWVKGDN